MIDAIHHVWKRVRGAVGLGQVNIVDDAGPVQKLQGQLGYLETRDGLPSIQNYGFTSNPPVGSDIVAIFVGGDRSNGLVVGTNHQTLRMRGLASGESAQYDSLGKYVYLSATGIVVNAAGQPVTVNNASTVTVNAAAEVLFDTPILKCTGDILDHCNTQTETMAGQRANFNLHTHNIENIEFGSQTRVSDVPNQQET